MFEFTSLILYINRMGSLL